MKRLFSIIVLCSIAAAFVSSSSKKENAVVTTERIEKVKVETLQKSKIARKIELEKAKINTSMVSDQLKMQEEQLKFDLKSALENYESQKKNVAVARRSFDNINKKYEQGMVSSLDLTQSNSNYLQAESNFIQASLSLMQAQIKLEKLYSQL